MSFKYVLFDPRSPRRFWRLFVYLYILGILFFSLRPEPAGGVEDPLWLQNFKNFLHIPAYFGLTFLLLCGLGRISWGTKLTAFFLAVGYGGINEIIQMSVPGRSSSWDDVARNTIGALVAVIFVRTNPIVLTIAFFRDELWLNAKRFLTKVDQIF